MTSNWYVGTHHRIDTSEMIGATRISYTSVEKSHNYMLTSILAY